ncbi:type I DNA topoisomerase [Xanthomonas perforans]|uniref:type I DNA topoisomerase n=1 Tax=Xanthomonas perforans TaxID=442694 RepID=UPI002358F5EE|nr:type I DNA topoisomerase [Xanthomonas perforans]MDC9654369.1 type I DNA topoisomerase [Xanthomonas perforans]
MSKTLVIVESPKKAKTISAFLGSGYQVMASKGHVRDLPQNELGVEAPEFVPNYVNSEKGAKTLQDLAQAAQSADTIVLATDPDREGEAIAWHLREALALAPERCQRVTFNAVAEKTVKAALAAPRDIDMALVDAQQARRVIDRLVGYQVSSALRNNLNLPVSAGRVQTPAIRIVVDRDDEIRNFKPTAHFGVELQFAGGWTAEWDTKPHLGDGEYLLDNELAKAVAAIRDVTVLKFADKTTRRGPKAPFTTSTMQQAAVNTLRMRSAATMEAAQALKDAGHITYHRTDSPNVEDVTYEGMVAFYATLGIEMAPRRMFKAKDSAQEAHDPIIPIDFTVREAGETKEQRELYKLIWARAVASQMPDAVYASRKAVLQARVGGELVTFVATGSTLVTPGWRAVHVDDESDDDQAQRDAKQNPVPALQEGHAVVATNGVVQSKKTAAPKRYTEASLIKKMENEGIGRPSTYAVIMTKITESGYTTYDGDFLVPTSLAVQIRDALVGRFSFAELAYTREVEVAFDNIANGKTSYLPVVRELNDALESELARIGAGANAVVHPCPACSRPLRRKPAKEQGKFFWGCSDYPNCDTTLPDRNNAPGARAVDVDRGVDAELYPCPQCAAPMRLKKIGQDAFWACSAYPTCKHTQPDNNGVPGERKTPKTYSCPTCSKPLKHKVKLGPSGFNFWSCSTYPVCKTILKNGADGAPIFPATTTGTPQ